MDSLRHFRLLAERLSMGRHNPQKFLIRFMSVRSSQEVFESESKFGAKNYKSIPMAAAKAQGEID